MRKDRVVVVQHGRGALVRLNLDDGGWNGHYALHTEGLTEFEVAAKANAIALHHQKKAARLTGFRDSMTRTFNIAGTKFTVTDCTLWERGTDVELYTAMVADGIDRVVMRRVYRDVDAVPSDTEIAALLREVAQNVIASARSADAHVKAVKQLLGVGGV